MGSARCLDSCYPTFIDFTDARTGWLTVGTAHSAAVSGALLFLTVDGGSTWRKVTAGDFTGPVAFSGARTGCAQEGPLAQFLLCTHDGGRTWRRARLRPLKGFGPNQVAFGVPSFFGSRVGVVETTLGGSGPNVHDKTVLFYVTHDGGRTWRATTPLTTHGFRQYRQVPADASTPRDFVVGSPDGLIASHDGGRTWSSLSTNVGLVGLSQVDFVTPRVGIIMLVQPRESRVFWTTDGGKRFVGADPGVEH